MRLIEQPTPNFDSTADNDCSFSGRPHFHNHRLALLHVPKNAICNGTDDPQHLEPPMLRTAFAVLTLSVATIASAQNRPPGLDPDVVDFCVYGGQFYSLGASICVGKEVAIKCIRYGVVTNELRTSMPPRTIKLEIVLFG